MESKIQTLIRMKREPVCVLLEDRVPEGAVQFKEDQRGCMIGLFTVAAKGRTAALTRETTGCRGGVMAATGYGWFPPHVKYFLSNGGPEGSPPLPMEPERYKRDPEIVEKFLEQVPRLPTEKATVLKPISQVTAEDSPSIVVFLVNADQLSALVGLANYNRPGLENVKVLFGPGCAQTMLYARDEAERGGDLCYIGLTDPSARVHMEKDLLAFSMPYQRFLEMEEVAEESFLTTGTWQTIAKRIED